MRPVPERQAAKAAGERFYWTGKPCRNGHLSKRYTGTGLCAMCAIKNTLNHQAKQPEHPNRIAARAARERHYSLGFSCLHGHEDKRFVSNGVCVQCSIMRTKKWHSVRPGYEAAAARKRRANDPTKHRAGVKRYAAKNPEKIKAAIAAWKAANIEHVRRQQVISTSRYLARKMQNGGDHTADDITQLHQSQRGRCAACKEKRKLEVDHIVPVIRGGSNNPSNLQLLCRRCNASKGAHDAIDWARKHGRLL